MSKKKSGHKPEEESEEYFCNAVNLSNKFLRTEDEKEFHFPTSFTSDERAVVHHQAKNLGLYSKSRGKGARRFITV